MRERQREKEREREREERERRERDNLSTFFAAEKLKVERVVEVKRRRWDRRSIQSLVCPYSSLCLESLRVCCSISRIFYSVTRYGDPLA